ncbi:hypothetical protein [Stenotrophomonas bentonitica]
MLFPDIARSRLGARVVVCLAFLALSACAIVKPVWYQTRPDDPEQTVIIQLVGYSYIESLDGKRLAEPLETWNGGYYAVREIRIIPGKHTIAGTVSEHSIRTAFEFEETFLPGRYEISAVVEGYSVNPQLKRMEDEE